MDKNRRRVWLAWLLGCLLWLPVVSAAPDLYSATVAVGPEGPEQRNQAIADALVVVLQKLSGRRDIAGRTGLDELIEAAPGFVQQFRYQGTAGDDRRIWVRFDKTAVDRGLRGLGLPIWDSARPRTLVWVAVDRDGRRELFNPDNDQALLITLRRQAEQRGLPLVLPLLDLEDQTRLNVGDLWSAFEGPVRAASQRYAHDAILLGRLRRLGQDRWSGDWTLLLADAEAMTFDSGTGALALVAGGGVDHAVDRIAGRLAPVETGDGPSRLALRISGIRDLPDYAEVLRALQGQQAVRRLVVRYAAGDQLQVDLWVNGGVEDLRRGLTIDSRFVPDLSSPTVQPTPPPAIDAAPVGDTGQPPSATPSPEPGFDIAYRWVG